MTVINLSSAPDFVIGERGGPAPVMQRSHDRPAGLDNPRSPRRRSGMPNFEKYAWLFMRFSGIVLVFLALGHLFIMLMLDDGVHRIRHPLRQRAVFVHDRAVDVEGDQVGLRHATGSMTVRPPR